MVQRVSNSAMSSPKTKTSSKSVTSSDPVFSQEDTTSASGPLESGLKTIAQDGKKELQSSSTKMVTLPWAMT